MKFLCEQCKAKYQIADEKVAGKTVRMKCRKCGHLIEVRAAVVETSTVAAPPRRDPTTSHSRSAGQRPAPTAEGERPTAGALRSAADHRLQGQAGASARAAGLAGKSPSGPEPAGALEGAFKNVVRHEGSLSTTATHRGQRDEKSAPFDMADLSPNDEWYVGINGVPVGPIRLAELRRKAALGAVTEDSLVWQDGLDEWRPLRSFAELAASVREAMSRLSRPPASEFRASVPPPPPPRAPSRPPPAPAPRTSSSRAIPAPSRSNVVPIMSRLATAERLEEPRPDGTSPVPALAPEQPAAPLVVADPFAGPPAAAVGAPIAPAAVSEVPPQAKKSLPWIQLAMIAAAVAFGITTAIVVVPVFLNRPASPVPSAGSAVATPSAAAAPAPQAAASPTANDVPETVVNQPTITAKAPRGAGGAKAAAPADPQNPGRSLDLHALAQSAPTIAPVDESGGDAPKTPGQCFSEGQVQQVIGLHQVAIRRACWERNPTAKLTVNVSISMTIGSDGSPQGVSANGDEPSVAKCIENDVRAWRFPAMGCSQKTNFSLKFVRQ